MIQVKHYLFFSLFFLAGCNQHKEVELSSVTTHQLGNIEKCKSYAGLPVNWPNQKDAGMVKIPAGKFSIGTNDAYPEERSVLGQQIQVNAFMIDQTEVTNAQFDQFVKTTHYITDAEKQEGGAVFIPPDHQVDMMQWWHFVQGADWRHPWGKVSSRKALPNEPVRLITWNDAMAYANWLGHDLPTEAEWEYAAKGYQSKSDVGPNINGKISSNTWQGDFPYNNETQDGFADVAPVGCFSKNPFGLYDMIGNVWELTNTPFTGNHDHHMGDPSVLRQNNGEIVKYTIKGGSYLCSENYCQRYRAASRQPQEIDLATSHVGFRTVKRLSE
ncbi:formylglycine-generating enzyme family protein [Acinetobacter pittii]|uniref:formylglycine-generating enzyme family protein n=1 Tax=Acinetobacter pittii TaxID=48296 RepID=UPI0021CDCF95|nr:formylglycine-generating enzyme family protein [Acinetobacter pittii]MCU4707761.1 formylglycine-generating enzyme family protein [Acinetobacter pittii]